jgi:hypothetical protein
VVTVLMVCVSTRSTEPFTDKSLGALGPSMRNFILSHSSTTFDSNYQANAILYDLLKIAFPGNAYNSDAILKQTRRVFLGRDVTAPVFITKEEIRAFDDRPLLRNY